MARRAPAGARSTSSARILPSGPVPAMAESSSPRSRAIRRARGDALMRAPGSAAAGSGEAPLPAAGGVSAVGAGSVEGAAARGAASALDVRDHRRRLDADVPAVLPDHGDRRPDFGLTLLDDDLEKDAVDLRLDLLRHLVRVELVEWLVDLDGIALRLEPADDRAGFHALAESWELDLGRHHATSSWSNSSSATGSISVIMLIVDEARRSVARDGGRLPRRLGGRQADADRRAAERPPPCSAGSRLDQRRQGRRHARLPGRGAAPAPRASRRRCACSSGSTAIGSGATSSGRTCRLRSPTPAGGAAEALRPTGSVAESWDRALAPPPLRLDGSPLRARDRVEHAAPPRRAPVRAAEPCAQRFSASSSPSAAPVAPATAPRRRCRGAASSASTAKASSARPRVLRVLSDTDNVDTQGPVWLVGGKTL